MKINILLFAIRFIVNTWGLLAISLIDPAFQPGGRYRILLLAFLTSIGSYGLRKLVRYMTRFTQSAICACGVVVGVFLVQGIVNISLDWLGAILLGIGIVMFEMALPEEQVLMQSRQR